MGNEKIIQSGLKLTIQRSAILEFLENTIEHPSAEVVYNHIHKQFPSITLSTVYNTLESFVEKKIICKIFSLDGKSRYDAKVMKHHHFYDKNTGQIIDIYDEELNNIMSEYVSQKKMEKITIEDFHIDFTGKINEFNN